MPNLQIRLDVRSERNGRGRWEGKAEREHKFDPSHSIPGESTFTLWELNERAYLIELLLPGRNPQKEYILLAKLFKTERTDRHGRQGYFGDIKIRLIGRMPQNTKFNMYHNDRSNSFTLYIGNE